MFLLIDNEGAERDLVATEQEAYAIQAANPGWTFEVVEEEKDDKPLAEGRDVGPIKASDVDLSGDQVKALALAFHDECAHLAEVARAATKGDQSAVKVLRLLYDVNIDGIVIGQGKLADMLARGHALR